MSTPSHSDAGSQYTSIAYTDRLDEIGADPSIGTIGDSYDNALAESTIGLFKTELHRNPAALATVGGHWKGLDDLELATCGWVSWFNEERFHGELDDLTPAEVEVRSKANARATLRSPQRLSATPRDTKPPDRSRRSSASLENQTSEPRQTQADSHDPHQR